MCPCGPVSSKLLAIGLGSRGGEALKARKSIDYRLKVTRLTMKHEKCLWIKLLAVHMVLLLPDLLQLLPAARVVQLDVVIDEAFYQACLFPANQQ